MTLNELLTYGNTLEKTDIESKKIERTQESSSPSNQAYSLHNKQQGSRHNAHEKNQQKTPSGTRQPARKQRGGQFPHEGGKTKCPAYDKTCHQCNKIGHFAKHCLSGPKKATPKDDKAKVQQLKAAMTSSSEEDSEEKFIFTITNSQKQPTVTIYLGNIPVSLVVDSGSSVNLINNDTFKRLQSINQSIKLVPSKTKIFPYGTTTPIETKGQFDITICYKQRHVTKSCLHKICLATKRPWNLAY